MLTENEQHELNELMAIAGNIVCARITSNGTMLNISGKKAPKVVIKQDISMWFFTRLMRLHEKANNGGVKQRWGIVCAQSFSAFKIK